MKKNLLLEIMLLFFHRNIVEVIKSLQKKYINSTTFEMVVGRATLLKNAFRRMDKPAFNPQNKLQVT